MTRALKAVLVHSTVVGCCPAMLQSTPSIGESGAVVDAEPVDPGQNDLEEALAAHRRRVADRHALADHRQRVAERVQARDRRAELVPEGRVVRLEPPGAEAEHEAILDYADAWNRDAFNRVPASNEDEARQ